MSFLTPARLQDSSRILRGLALVAAKAAADSPALRRAGQGDFNAALKETMKAMSQQSKQAAEILDATSREQTGVPLEHHMQRGREAADTAASMVRDRAQAVFRDGQQAAQSAAQQPQATFKSVMSDGQRAAENLSGSAQQGMEGVRSTLGSVAQQGQEAAQRAAPQSSQAFQEAADDAQSAVQNFSRGAQHAIDEAPSAATASTSAEGTSKSIVVDFSGGSGTATTGESSTAEATSSVLPSLRVPSKTEEVGGLQRSSEATGLDGAAVRPQSEVPLQSSSALASEGPRMPQAQATGLSQQIRTEDLRVTPQSSTPAKSAGVLGVGSGGQAGGSIAGASEVLRSHSQSGEVSDQASQQPMQPTEQKTAPSEAERLLAEERALSEKEAQVSGSEKAQVQAKKEEVRKKLTERRVPSSPIGRVAGFAQLGASLVYGTFADQVSSYFGGKEKSTGGNKYMTERNAERLADALCRMRGAALKLGQMISIQDESVLPPQLAAAFERVRAGADVMPRKQLHKVINSELGSDWRSKLADFEDDPLAAASIGQVHGATLHDGRRVVMKIQYPGVARSIESDVDNLMRIIRIANVLPKGLYIENAAKVAKKELKLECDYVYEARCQSKFVELIAEDPDFKGVMHVPNVIPELCSGSVLTSEWVPGVHIDKVAQMPQKIRDAVGTLLLQLTLKELFEWRFMQTDPNWGNFLYDEAAGKLNLIDFGAAREFPVPFVDDYLSMVKACAERDRDGVIRYSTKLGFLTGDESNVMLDAHSNAGFVVGTPFSNTGLYDFATHSSLTKQVSQLGAVMLKHRLTPPPEESYSLHRKLSGAFLACIKLRAKVPCHELFFGAYERHKWGHAGFKTEDLPDLDIATG